MPKLKDSVIDTTKGVFAQVVFATIEDCADATFDKKLLNAVEISFLKDTPLSDISYENTSDLNKFIIRNNKTNCTIEVSNRTTSSNELRGDSLRDILDKAMRVNPEQSLYITLNNTLNNPNTSPLLAKSKGYFVGLKKSPYEDGQIMDEHHYKLFAKVLIELLKQKKNEGKLEDVTYKGILKTENDVRDHIWEGIDIDSIYEATSSHEKADEYFTKQLAVIRSKAEDLEKRGYKAEAKLARDLVTNLELEQTFFKTGVQDINTFYSHCNGFIEEAKKSDLANIRGFGKLINILQNGLIAFANWFISPFGGHINEAKKESDTSTKLSQMNRFLFVFKFNDETPNKKPELEPKIDSSSVFSNL
jgi:hypothetical protein